MNIYIPDIKLPKDEPGAFQVIVMYVGADGKLRAGCKGTHEVTIVPPHGRLIDADALMARFEKEEKAADEHGRDFSFSFKSAGENCAEWWSVQQMLFDAPTIIPAEEGE